MIPARRSSTSATLPRLVHFPNRRARRYLLALLQPVRGTSLPVDFSVPAGLLISSNPSQSTGIQSAWCILKARCCSLRAEYTMIALPSRTMSVMRIHSRSRTRAETCPTKTPGDISSSHLVRSPLNPTGHAVSTTTITASPFPLAYRHMICRPPLPRAVRPIARHDLIPCPEAVPFLFPATS